MNVTGLFRFALLPGVDPAAFEDRMRNVFDSPNALKATRITRRFDHTLLGPAKSGPGDDAISTPGPQYVWLARIELQTNAGYSFDENGPSVQQQVVQFALLIGIESYVNVE